MEGTEERERRGATAKVAASVRREPRSDEAGGEREEASGEMATMEALRRPYPPQCPGMRDMRRWCQAVSAIGAVGTPAPVTAQMKKFHFDSCLGVSLEREKHVSVGSTSAAGPGGSFLCHF